MNENKLMFPGLIDTDANSVFCFWRTIQKFSEIDIQPNTIVLCDIDDTLLHHPAINPAWTNFVHTFFHITGNYDRNVSHQKASKYCDEIFDLIPMEHTDRSGFFDMVEKSAEFVFVTARPEVAKDFTYMNLKSIDVDPEKHKVYFSSGVPKGDYIKRNFDLTNYDHVVFIDDQVGNLENVLSAVEHPGLEIYRFMHDKTEQPANYYPLPPGCNVNTRFDGFRLI